MPSKQEIEQQVAQLLRLTVHDLNQGRFLEAAGPAERARKLARSLGENHPYYASSLNNLAGLYSEVGDYAAAEPLYREALALKRAELGESHPDFALGLNNLADLYRTMGNYTAAEPLLRQALAIRRAALGEEHPDYATSLNNLAGLYHTVGNYAAAEPLFRQAAAICRTVLGEKHPDYAGTLDNLAGVYQALGDYDQAESLCRQALEIRRAALGEKHPLYTASLNNLATLYCVRGDYTRAESLLQQVLAIDRRALGEDHPDYAADLNNLAFLYQSLGNYPQAVPLFRQALEICRTALGEDHPSYAQGLNNLAASYHALGDYAAAKPLLEQAVAVRRAALGEDHPDYAQSLNNLAAVHRALGDYTEAEALLRQALAIRRAALGENHPDCAESLNNLAALSFSRGDYMAAEPLYRQALALHRAAQGTEHPLYAQSLLNLATLYAATGRAGEALPMMREALTSDERLLAQIFSIGSEEQRLTFLQATAGNLTMFLSLVLRLAADAPAARQQALDLLLRRKAVAAEALAAQRDAILGGRHPELREALEQLVQLRRYIARKTLSGPAAGEEAAAHHARLEEWHTERQRLEQDLARQIPEMNLEQRLRAADRRAVALALPEGVALVEFVRFDVVDFTAVAARGEAQVQPARYLAFVLPAGEPDDVEMLDLGETEPIDRMIADFRAGITGDPDDRARSQAVVEEPAGTSAPGIELRRAVLDPLLPALAGKTKLLLCPDGDLTRLPFEVLPADTGTRLIDTYHISYLTSGRDVLRFGAARSGEPAPPLVAADPDFDLGGSAPKQPAAGAKQSWWSWLTGRGPEGGPRSPAPVPPTSEERGEREEPVSPDDVPPSDEGSGPAGRYSRDLDRHGARRLPGTRIEGERIAALLGVQPWLDGSVLEQPLKAYRSPHILHLATHGFFLKDQDWDRTPVLPAPPRRQPRRRENPLLRSGLLLAGYNTWLARGELPPAAEDGMLTAEDVTGMDLIDTELVVLSACETGLGQVQVGEGVFGLRRAFVLAGAKTLVMSLWKVPDRQTQELMADFYRRVLKGEPRAEALRQAQLALKAKEPDPYYWGAFICQGDPGPLPVQRESSHAAP